MVDETRLLRRSVDTLADVFYIYDDRGELVVWNDRLNDLFGLTDEQLRGMTPVDFFIEDDRPAVERAVAEIFDAGETVVEARAETTDGTIRFELTGHRLTDDDGTLLGFCGVGRDVTERRQQERTLELQNTRLTDFARTLAHDVRNPLGVATGYVERCIETGETDDLERVEAALDRIDRIVDDVLTVAVEGQAAIVRRPVALDAVAREAWSTVDTADATLDVRTTMTVSGDEPRVRRLFENLFRNSVEHGSRGKRGAPGEAVTHGGASVTVTVEETTAGFAVADDGAGIAPDEREHLFEPGHTGGGDGTGFGLYIVKTIAEAHGWEVSLAESATGGARFEFTLVPDVDDELGLVS